MFLNSPLSFIFSMQGSWIAAILLSILFAFLVYWEKKQAKLASPIRTTVMILPHQLMPKLVIWAAIWGFLGAKIFNYLENIQMYSSYSFVDFFKYSGLTFLGGLICGGLGFLYVAYKKGMRLINLVDIGSPGMLVAYGVGRLGCHLSGDGDWGIANVAANPFPGLPNWVWSFNFPHNVLNKGVYISGCNGNYCSVLPHGVFPTSFYESVIILSCFFLLWFNRKNIQIPGLIFSYYLMIMGIERLLIEEIRINFKYDIMGLHLSEAQFISLIFIFFGGILCIYSTFQSHKGK
ncbi:prolipoprotein diacylglyceryl transferase family protein, partial [Pedobacter sp.]|uniref:prolipoprotein diacylglyceryl transferase family protein n=1 Tax=Pedobacter sp. TaxID=1411316 RepID=UPI003D7FDBBE